jgi:hypothetical protein
MEIQVTSQYRLQESSPLTGEDEGEGDIPLARRSAPDLCR